MSEAERITLSANAARCFPRLAKGGVCVLLSTSTTRRAVVAFVDRGIWFEVEPVEGCDPPHWRVHVMHEDWDLLRTFQRED